MKKRIWFLLSICGLSLLSACGGSSGGSSAPPPQPLAITSGTPPGGTIQAPFGGGSGFLLSASGGVPPYVWSWTAAAGSSLPPGLNISNGTITGTPTATGTFNVIVTVSDGESPAKSVSAPYAVTINPPAALAITSGAPPPGETRNTYQGSGGFLLTASGGLMPYRWSWSAASGSSLPPGLTISTNVDGTGTISGIGATPGTFNVVVTVSDSAATIVTANYMITPSAPPPLAISSDPPPDGTVGAGYNPHNIRVCVQWRNIPFPRCIRWVTRLVFFFPLMAAGGINGTTGYTWALAAGSSLPPGLQVSNSVNVFNVV